jgi:hypothetical protein
MSNLDDVIKDILGNMFYDRSKTITEQIAPNMRYRTPGSQNVLQDPEKLNTWNQFRNATITQTVPAGTYSFPVKYRGIQNNLDLVVPSTKKDVIRVDEFQNTQAPFDKNGATNLFGNWCKALSSGNMTGTNGEDFWYDTTDPVLAQCSATTEYSPKYLSNTEEIDPNYGLKNILSIPDEMRETYEIPDYYYDSKKRGFGNIAAPTDNTRVQTNKNISLKPKKNLFSLGEAKSENTNYEKWKIKNPYKSKIDYVLTKNPRFSPYPGWGLYQKNWDFVPNTKREKIGQIVKLPISPTTGNAVYKVYDKKCLPLNYDQCLEISWSLLNTNAQPNGMKKFSLLSEKKEVLGTYIACSSAKSFKKSLEKNEENPYPWTMRYDGYCFALDGVTCEDVSFDTKTGKKVLTKEPCETNMSEITYGLDIRDNTINLPGNRVGYNRGETYQNELYKFFEIADAVSKGEKYGGMGHCAHLKGNQYNECINNITQKANTGAYDIDDVEKAALYKNGMVVIGKI